MAHFALLWKARTIEKYRQNYENEKVNSIIISNSDIPETTLFQRWRHYRHDMRKRLSRTFSKWYPEGTTVSNFFVSLQTDMGFASILLRSLYGFVGGLLLTYLGFMFFVFQLSLSLMHATVLSSIMGMILTLGLTFSNRIRCLIFLLVPQLFSRVGRYTLTCYALILILTGPATNTLKNSEVLSESMACFQEQIKLNVRQINESMKKPLNSIKASLKITIDGMQIVVGKLKIALIRINRLILSIASIIQSGYYWLGSVVNECNEALGTPYEKCLNALKENFQRCEENLDLNHVKRKGAKNVDKDYVKNLLEIIAMKEFTTLKYKEKVDIKDVKAAELEVRCSQKSKDKINRRDKKISDDKNYKPWFQNTLNVAKIACASLKSYGKFCDAADFAKETIMATIKRQLKTFTQHISLLLHVRVNIRHTYTFIGNSSSTNQIAAGIVTEIRNRADPIITWLSWSSCVTSLFLLLIIFRAKHYQHMFETRSRFDNRYITKEFRELDLKRLRERRETVLPLNRRERVKYVTTTSFRLVSSEKVHLNRSALFMIITTLKLLIHMVADYSLYWVLMTIRHHGKLQTPMQPGLADTGAFITGTGFVASLLQSFIDTLNIQLIIPPPDVSCLPNPHPPDFKRYCQIGFLIFLLWFFALFEPYGLRLRHLIMGHYRPERAKARAVWLYNHILRTRARFMKFARRRLHREHKYSSESKLTFGRTLQSLIPCCWLKLLLGIKPEEPHCLLCYITEDASDLNKELMKCEVYYCPGIYCTRCFSDIGQLCTVCLSPSDYGDLSDVSLEKGSSDEDNYDDSSDDDDDDDDSDKSYDLGSQNGFNKRNTSNDADAISDEYEGSPKGSKISKRNRILSHENNKNRGFENISLKQRCTQGNSAKILAKHRIIKVYTDVLERQPVKIYFVVFECFPPEHVSKKGYRGSIYLFENIAMLKDQNNNNVLAPRKRYSFQYSVYKITKNPFEIIKTDTGTQFSKFLRKKKLIRRKKKEAKMNPLYFKYFMACSQTNLNKLTEKTTQVKDNIDQAKVSNNLKSSRNETIDNSLEFKGMKNKNQNRGEHKSRKDTYKLSNKRSKNINKFHTTFAKCWKNVKLTVLPDWGITNTKRDLPPIKEKKHTRKKKHKNMKTHIKSSKNFKLKKIENNRNSRIFTYFDEQDWVNNCIDTTEKLNINKERSLKDLFTQKHDNVVVNNIIIPRLNLDESSESLTTLTKYSPFAIFDICHERVDFAKSALNRFFKSIRGKSDEILESNYIKYNFGETDLKFDEDKGSYLVKNNERISHFDLYNCKNPSKYNNLQANNLGGHRLKRIFSESVSVSKFSKSFKRIKSACSSLLVRNVGNQQKKTQSKNQNCEIVASMKNQKHAPNKYEKQIQFNTANPIQSLDDIKQRRILNVKEKNAENVQKRFIINKNTKETITVKMNQKQTEFDDEKQQPRPTIKEMLEDDKGHIKTKDKPINAREQEQFKEIKNEKEIQTMSTSTQMNDKSVTVVPSTNSCGCYCKVGTQDCAVQASTSFKRPKTQHNNVEVSTSHPLCTCAAQYHPSNKDVCTCFAGQSNSDSTRDSFSSISSEELKTDSTTVCSLSNKHYHSNRFGRFKVKVTTKTNQSTLTDKTHSCNVSTSTYDDWWSPIVDRKYNPRKEDNFLERKKRDYNLMRERKIFKNRGMCTRDKFVTFRSKTQVIPNPEFDYTDVLSPSRYLLESQKYYNELFYKLPFVYPIANIQKHQILDRERSQISSRHHSRRGHNSKRLEETYTSRNQRSPRKRGLEFGRYVAKK